MSDSSMLSEESSYNGKNTPLKNISNQSLLKKRDSDALSNQMSLGENFPVDPHPSKVQVVAGALDQSLFSQTTFPAEEICPLPIEMIWPGPTSEYLSVDPPGTHDAFSPFKLQTLAQLKDLYFKKKHPDLAPGILKYFCKIYAETKESQWENVVQDTIVILIMLGSQASQKQEEVMKDETFECFQKIVWKLGYVYHERDVLIECAGTKKLLHKCISSLVDLF